MKAFASIIGAAICITSPASLASAQVSQQQCRDQCQAEALAREEHCRTYGQSLDGEYCFLDSQNQTSACFSSCEYQGDAIASMRHDSTRYRPVQLTTFDRLVA